MTCVRNEKKAAMQQGPSSWPFPDAKLSLHGVSLVSCQMSIVISVATSRPPRTESTQRKRLTISGLATSSQIKCKMKETSEYSSKVN